MGFQMNDAGPRPRRARTENSTELFVTFGSGVAETADAKRPNRSDGASRRAVEKTEHVSQDVALPLFAGWACPSLGRDECGRGDNSERILTVPVSGGVH